MKRNMDLIRSLLLELEGEPVDSSDYSDEQLIYHKALLSKIIRLGVLRQQKH